MATTVYAYRARNDDGNETTATWKANQSTSWIQTLDQNLRIRFGVQNDTSLINNLDVLLQYSLNGTDWVAVSASSTVVRASASGNVADAANLTEQLTGGTGVFEGATAFDEVNGICGGTAYDIAATEHFEHEFCVQVRSADIANGNRVWLRTINNDAGTAWTTYNVTCSFWVGWEPKTAALPADDANNFLDSAAKTLVNLGATPKTFEGTSTWNNLADYLLVRTERATGWTDASNYFETLNANIAADAWNNLADSVAAIPGLLANLAPDNANNLTDAIIARLVLNANLADDANNLGDALVTVRGILARLDPDNANFWADPITGLMGDHYVGIPDDANSWSDSLNVQLFEIVADPINVNLGPDAMAAFTDVLGTSLHFRATLSDDANAFADTRAAFLTLDANISDSAQNLADSIQVSSGAALTVSLSDNAANLADYLLLRTERAIGWTDTAAKTLTAGAAIIAGFTDTWANLADLSMRVEADDYLNLDDDLNFLADSVIAAIGHRVALTDSAANLADSLAAFKALNALLTDDANNWTDASTAFQTLNASLLDDANEWADLVAKILTGQAALDVALSDTWGNLADSLSAFRTLAAALSDDAANLADSLAAIRGLLATFTDSANNLGDSLTGRLVLLAAFIDSAQNLLDQLATQVGGILALTANLGPDSLNNFADVLAARRALLASLTDDANNLADSVAAMFRLFARHGADSANNWLDSAAKSAIAQILANLPADAMTAFTDSVARSVGLLAAMSDDAANLTDSLAGQQELLAQLTDASANLADSLAGFEALMADLAPDDAAQLADALAIFKFIVGSTIICIAAVTLRPALDGAVATEPALAGDTELTPALDAETGMDVCAA